MSICDSVQFLPFPWKPDRTACHSPVLNEAIGGWEINMMVYKAAKWRRYLSGVMPKCRLNTCVKWLGLSKPVANPT